MTMFFLPIPVKYTEMYSMAFSYLRQWNASFLVFHYPNTSTARFICNSSTPLGTSKSKSTDGKIQFSFDSLLFGFEVDLKRRNVIGHATEPPRSWFGPNGQYIRELPCPSCRGRGYTPCRECGIERSRSDCSQCGGKGVMNCPQCSGDCVIWEESIDERPWEKARLISPVKIKEDDEVDNLDLKLDIKKKLKRVYQSPSPEVGMKISRSLRSLNAKTGLFSKRMKIIHQNPKLRALRVEAIKKAKGTAASKKRSSEALKAFFSNPENRRKRSISMKGVKFYCGNCGREGHRSFYCPELKDDSTDRKFRCRVCGEKGHNRQTCPILALNKNKGKVARHYRCKTCRKYGHNSRTCPQASKFELLNNGETPSGVSRRAYTCTFCSEKGHNVRTCPNKLTEP